MSKRIVLASGSPRRRALLEDLGISVDVRVSDVDETGTGTPEEVVLHNARIKCAAIAQTAAADEIVIAADTIVVLRETILGKPQDLDEARGMLRSLSGATHRVLTGVHIWSGETGTELGGVETTDVTFRELRDVEIERFVEIVQPLDRAGAYTVDGPGSLLVSGYAGCFYNVLGLPLVRLHSMLLQSGYDLSGEMDAKKTRFL